MRPERPVGAIANYGVATDGKCVRYFSFFVFVATNLSLAKAARHFNTANNVLQVFSIVGHGEVFGPPEKGLMSPQLLFSR